jgi:hypothetical protein
MRQFLHISVCYFGLELLPWQRGITCVYRGEKGAYLLRAWGAEQSAEQGIDACARLLFICNLWKTRCYCVACRQLLSFA